MAALTSSPSGFSYAQAARGQKSSAPSQASSSKVTSGTATPATGTFSELGPSSNWADDVEATSEDKTAESKRPVPEQNKPQPAKDIAVERTKSESRTPNGSSGVSSPDFTASSSTTTSADDASSAPNGMSSSDTTWETKSQASEPAWIAERKERQSSGHNEDGTHTGKGRRGKKEPREPKDSKDAKEPALPETPPVPVKLQDAPLPTVNPWAKRMEDAKVKPVATPPKPVMPTATLTENQRPSADSRKKASSVAAVPTDTRPTSSEIKKSNGVSTKRTEDRPRSKQGAEDTAVPAKVSVQREHHSSPNLTTAPPPVKDEGSWPTPENAQDKERKESLTESASKDGKDADDSTDAENSSGSKRHQKPTWKPMAVTPTIVWQTEEMNRPRGGAGGERGGRGGNSSRGRGGHRGGANGSKGERANGKSNGSPAEDTNGAASTRGRSGTLDRESMPPPPKPSHKSSGSESREGRRTRDHSSHDPSNHAKPSASGMSTVESMPVCAAPQFSDARRTKSPSKASPTTEQQEIKIPEPIPRQAANAAPADESREGSESARENSTARRGPYEGKKESRSFDSYNKEWSGAPRGGKRGGRGRGGSREFANGHQANQTFTNGHAEFASYGVPPSPSAYQTPRGQYSFSQQGRGSWSRNNPRSQSIPIDNVYGGSRPYWGQHPPQIQTGYYPGTMFDYAGVPMTAMPYNPMIDHQYLMEMVSTQLEYYFSLDNLLKDMFLRKHMDSQGFVFIDVIANFNRVKQLTVDKDLIKACCLRSESIEIRVGEDGKERLRRRQGWEQFLLPKEQREVSAQNDGPTVLSQPEPPQLQSFFMPPASFRGPPSAGLPGSQRRSHDAGFPVNGAVPPFAPFSPLAEVPPYGEPVNGEEMRGRATKSPIRESNGSPNQQSLMGIAAAQNDEPDDFADEHASTLTVVVKMQAQRPSHHHAASRTFSNGSIDTRSIFNEIEKPTENHAPPATNGEPAVNGDAGKAAPPRHASPAQSRSPEKDSQQSELSLFWVKDKDVPQNQIPDDSTLEPYHHLRNKALRQREQAATGACPYDLDVLYQFWAHFLIRNFNKRMYEEFKYFAHDDAQQRHSSVGLQNLVLFYSKALASSSSIRDSIVSDYVDLVKAEPAILQGQAFKQLRQAWRNGALNLKNRKKLADTVGDLKASLEP